MKFINRDMAIAHVEEQYRLFKDDDVKSAVVEGCVLALENVPLAIGWISVEQELPPVEERVLLSIRRHSEYSGKDYAITTCGIYEDGTVDIEDSCWCCDSEWADYDKVTDTCYVPKGWYEYHEYGDTENDGIGVIQPESCSGKITDKVTHWMPMIPNPYVDEVFQ